MYTVRTLKIRELPLLLRLFDYNKPVQMLAENTRGIKNRKIDIFGLFRDGKLIGELHVKYESADSRETARGTRAYLFAFRIEKNFRDKGFGRLLLNRVIEQLAAAGYTEFTVGVETDNAIAKHIYEMFGFTECIAQKEESYQGDTYVYTLLLKKTRRERPEMCSAEFQQNLAGDS